MEPISEGLLMALAGGAAGSAGQQVWHALRDLVARREATTGVEPPRSSIEGELTLLEQRPHDTERARSLAGALSERAERDPAFAAALAGLREQGERAHGTPGAARFEISGGTQHSVVQAQNVHGDITFN
ncbi:MULTISPECIES: hypothetical protein [unclassified Streptomyces]|uniref:hypothetical protein n=1 Tax=unclassified Streptomyces TaxID=2593676 RepID=UPI00235FF016|nr:hypothetical protein [Streptomyces sp. MMBL 11-1]